MIVKELSPGAIAMGLKGMLQSQGGRAVQHWHDRWEAVEVYQGECLDKAVKAFFPDPAILKQVPPDLCAIVGKIIDARFIVYKDAPAREADERYLAALETLDRTMPQVERLTGLLGTMALLTSYHADETGAVLEHRPLIEFEPIFLPDGPDPVGVLYPLHQEGADPEDQRWACWTLANHFVVTGRGMVEPVVGEDGTVNEELVNPYGVLPVTFAHRCARGRDWWRPIAEDILNAQTVYNVLGTHINIGVMLQGLGQPWMSGRFDGKGLKLSPFDVLKLEEGSQFNYATPGTNLAPLAEIQRSKVDAVCFSHSLKIKWADNTGGTSGEHQRILEVDLTEAVLGDFALWRQFERERFEVDRAVLAAYGVTISEDYAVNFTEPHIPPSVAERQADWKFRRDNNLASNADYFREMDPDMDDAAIAERLQRIIDDKAMEPKSTTGGSLLDLLAAPAPGVTGAA